MNNVEKMTLTVPEMAEALSIGKNSAYDLVHRKDFPKIRIGNKILVPKVALEKWLLGDSLSV